MLLDDLKDNFVFYSESDFEGFEFYHVYIKLKEIIYCWSKYILNYSVKNTYLIPPKTFKHQ